MGENTSIKGKRIPLNLQIAPPDGFFAAIFWVSHSPSVLEPAATTVEPNSLSLLYSTYSRTQSATAGRGEAGMPIVRVVAVLRSLEFFSPLVRIVTVDPAEGGRGSGEDEINQCHSTRSSPR